MEKIIFLLLMLGGFCFAADPAEGFWLSVDEQTGRITAGWEIYQNRGKLYGKPLSTAEHPPDVKAMPCKESYPGFPVAGKVNEMLVVGTPWIFGLTLDKTGHWSGGNIINVQDGNMYRCKIIYHPEDGKKFQTDTLEVRGEIGLGIGRSQFWIKTTRGQAASLKSN
ncbi:MAG: DUF2147 domain-containing protein [Spirochaetaceae bacterium]|jgi:uncharacterized protein (DUF2147 family)|nr:DUF2147 domain-containing protein [Spirochaetaceae bacterium]